MEFPFKFNTAGKFVLSKKLFTSKILSIVLDYTRLPKIFDSGRIGVLGDNACLIYIQKDNNQENFKSELAGFDEYGQPVYKQKDRKIHLYLIMIHKEELFDLYFPSSIVNTYALINGSVRIPLLATKLEYESGYNNFYELID